MDRQAALARVHAIAARRAELMVELTELQAEDTQLRRFFRLQKTSEVLEASAYNVYYPCDMNYT